MSDVSSEKATKGVTEALQRIVGRVKDGRYRLNLHRVSGLEEIVEAHRHMEAGRATGKLVLPVNLSLPQSVLSV
jgi:NADPH:quinone reductase-like Zn-dependent oxidoreductase